MIIPEINFIKEKVRYFFKKKPNFTFSHTEIQEKVGQYEIA